MTKDFSHDRFFLLLPPLHCLLTTEGDFSSSAAAEEPMDMEAFVGRFLLVFLQAHELRLSCGGELRELRRAAAALKSLSGSAGNLETRPKHYVKSQGGKHRLTRHKTDALNEILQVL